MRADVDLRLGGRERERERRLCRDVVKRMRAAIVREMVRKEACVERVTTAGMEVEANNRHHWSQMPSRKREPNLV